MGMFTLTYHTHKEKFTLKCQQTHTILGRVLGITHTHTHHTMMCAKDSFEKGLKHTNTLQLHIHTHALRELIGTKTQQKIRNMREISL